MQKILFMVFTTILTSFYLFPFDFTFLPGYNTKKVLAGLSIVILGIKLAKGKSASIDKDFVNLLLAAFTISLCGFISIIYNDTNDLTYTTYIISMLVWLGGAYTIVATYRWLYKSVFISTVVCHLAAVCTLQCLIALAIDHFPTVYSIVRTFYNGMDELNSFADGRLYGIGCCFDPAGMRFAAVLVLMSCLIPTFIKENKKRPFYIFLFLLSFLVIAVVGNMIARTTTIGLVMALFNLCFLLKPNQLKWADESLIAWRWLLGTLVLFLPIVIFAYYHDEQIHKNIRFAFEGFFSLIEVGSWEVHSNDMLMGQIFIFPETLKTWIIGDGYIDSTLLDPYYTGKEWKGYYMGIDVGYLRLIYYFGVCGLTAFILFLFRACYNCMKNFPSNKWMFILILALNLIVWVKVASDIFVIFALFLVFKEMREEEKKASII